MKPSHLSFSQPESYRELLRDAEHVSENPKVVDVHAFDPPRRCCGAPLLRTLLLCLTFYIAGTGVVRALAADDGGIFIPNFPIDIVIPTNSVPVPPQGQLQNPGFEEGTTGWFGFGFADLSAPTTLPHTGNRSALVAGRTAPWNGVAQSILGVLQPSATYHISAWVRLASGSGQPVQLTVQQTDSRGTFHLAIDTGAANSADWTLLQGEFTPTVNGTLTGLTLYLEGPAAGVSFYADDFEIEALTPVGPRTDTPPDVPAVDGYLDAHYRTPLALQTVQTGFGDNLSELDALYAVVVSNDLYLFVAGNLENNYNKLNIFIDSIPGGQQAIDASQNPNNDDWAVRHDGFTFDDGFDADFAFNFRQGSLPGVPPAFFDFTVVGGGSNDFDLYVNPFTSGQTTGYGTTQPGANLGYIFELGFNGSNTGGVTSGSGAADQSAAQAVSTGFELRIPLAAIGNPTQGTVIRLVAMVNGRYHDFLSNQMLPGFVPPQDNLGGDGLGNFTGNVGGIDLRNFGGTQFAELMISDTDLMQQWTRSSAPNANWGAAACSTDGTKLVAVVQNGPIYTSIDAGTTWTQTSAPTNYLWSAVASSADGNTLVAVSFPGPIYVSTDAGATWAQSSAPATYHWGWVACSADGSQVVAVPYHTDTSGSGIALACDGGGNSGGTLGGGGGGCGGSEGASLIYESIYLSSDSGATWTPLQVVTPSDSPGSIAWTSVAMSQDGSRLIASGIGADLQADASGETLRGYALTSDDAGANWQTVPLGTNLWNWVASSGDGSTLLAAGGPVVISGDRGGNWQSASLPSGYWLAVASSASGARMLAAEYPGRLVSTLDGGTTWTLDNAPIAAWNGVAMSADGSTSVAVVYGGGIWISRSVLENTTPIADASATSSLVIAPNGINVNVVLDGSLSSDPDGDALDYEWSEASGTEFGTGVAAAVVLPLGLTPLDLVVTDGAAADTNSIIIEVVTFREALTRLADGSGPQDALIDALEQGTESVDDTDPLIAMRELKDVQIRVMELIYPEDSALAAQLMAYADEVISRLDPSGSHEPVRLVAGMDGGAMTLCFQGDPTGLYIIEASTDLVDWEAIGVASSDGAGNCTFEDAEAATHPWRFYRVVEPNPR